ncbi:MULTISPECIES: response regulator transcription factor [unclassified Tolypothrix]|uniref:response regulator transcription factor n=1 Tax=unclassified Tolypothrix TaxID=2649714 RepID=UPI0005EABD16|nr:MULTISPECIES: response regulator transcription factor [unclassified Tolypothrix]BAY90060.1 LuxR family two component transcriptional regulator [Microchaete diplosiphon NIES-3275]EKE97461.1 response regulator [Tolypothrix sp. PCC 7601]MBE9084873.1 response regulator transcription factor [Tolypothrix sp. LEGE 11397]UYD24282.1 response regulator transcription factor [Tolypothrix sp. PCC 7712]UYD33487.1 response regulator transcription factor [Tolypothrix sp. PCC 7601]
MIRLLLVEDQSLIRDGIKVMLNLESDLEVVGTADNGETAIEQATVLQPDVILMDIQMPVMDGKAATRIICQRFPGMKVLVLTTFDDDENIAEAMRAGAKGYLLKDMRSEELAQAIRFVYKGFTQMAPGLFEKMLGKAPASEPVSQEKTPQQNLGGITNREQEVLQLIGMGATNREIAEKLYISEGTVKTHVTNLFNRLNVKNRSQLAIYANSILNK